jgi:hypothetical protein
MNARHTEIINTWLAFVTVGGTFLGLIFGYWVGQRVIKTRAIEAGVARYVVANNFGALHFEWITNKQNNK